MSIKLTKNELKRQKDSLRQYQRFLPTLTLKKRQLQSVIREYRLKMDAVVSDMRSMESSMAHWIGVFGENPIFSKGVAEFIRISEVRCDLVNIAGVAVPDFKEVVFSPLQYDLEKYPLWVDRGIQALKDRIVLDVMSKTLEKAVQLLESELKSTAQRVNLFEKVMIPKTVGNIRKIQVALQDQQTAGVVKGKIAKSKLLARPVESGQAQVHQAGVAS